MLSGMTYTLIHTPTPACDLLQVAESHEVIGIVRNSWQVVKAIPYGFRHEAASGRNPARALAASPDFRRRRRIKFAITCLPTYG